jgi:hypothetical protein
VGQPGHRWLARHRPRVQPPWLGHHGQTTKVIYLLVMSSSRAGSSHSSSWRIFGSACDLFHFSSELKIDWKTSWNFNSQLKTFFYYFL